MTARVTISVPFSAASGWCVFTGEEMLKIDMLKFFRSGEFAGVERGLSCAQIASMFGSAGASFKSAGAEILRYGAFEFHFFRDEIFMIFQIISEASL